MEISELIDQLVANKVAVSLDGKELKVKFQGTSIDPELLTLLKSNKQALISYLESIESANYEEIPTAKIQEDYPLSDGQYRLWVLSQYDKKNLAYNIHGEFTLNNVAEISILENAILAVVERHEALRTVFVENDKGEARQKIVDQKNLGFKVNVVPFLNADRAEVTSYIKQQLQVPFDLENGPLIRIELLQVGPSDYMFFYNMHHIISDGWSMGILYADVLAYYEAFKNGETPYLAPLNIQYKDYAVWQNEQFKAAKFESYKTYWLAQLSGEIPLLDLPSRLTRPSVKNHNGRRLNVYYSAEFTARVKAYCSENEGSLFIFLQAALNTLFHRYTGNEDIVTGSPTAGRTHPSIENQIGFYVNTLALRHQISGNDNFGTVFQKIKETTLQAMERQDYPLEKLVEELDLKRNPARSVLFDVMIELQNTLETAEDAIEKATGVSDLGACASKFDSTFIFQEHGKQLGLILEFDQDVYDKDSIHQLIKHFEQIANAVMEHPEMEIGRIDYLTNAEKEQLLAFNPAEVTFPKGLTVAECFEQQVAKEPYKLALHFEKVAYTYDALNALANQLAHFIRAKYNVQPNDLIGIKLHRSDSLVYSVLGVLKSGAAYVAIDPNYPKERIAYLIDDSKCKVVIDDEVIETFLSESKKLKKSNLPITSGPKDLAYVIYTSGSTGKPKGVLIEQESIVARLSYMKNIYDLTNMDKSLFYRSYSFDGAIEEYLLPFTVGATCIVAGREFEENLLDNIKECIFTYSITKLNMPPVLLNEFVNSIDQYEADKIQESLRHLISGGDKLSSELAALSLSVLPNVTLHNTYGPTENTIDSTHLALTGHQKGDLLSIGYPIENTRAYILDKKGELLPIGIPGELCFSGVGVARGYLNRPELTAEKFVTDPFFKEERMYKSGDLARWTEQGELEFLGRLDEQVKIRGFRIEIGEIEAVLNDLKGITDAVVLVNETEKGNKDLIAYIVSEEKQNISSVREQLKETLPAYMLPAVFVQLKKLPVTVNGKVDRRALLEMDAVIMESGTEFIAPRNENEIIISEVWQAVLKQNRVGIKDNFYDLGGDSIKSIQVVSRIKQKGFELKIEQLLRTPILEEVAQFLKQNARVIDQSPVHGEVLLTPIQSAFFQNKTIPVKHYFNQAVALEWTQRINVAAMKASLSHLILHHDALRSNFVPQEENWIQTVQDSNQINVEIELFDFREDKDQSNKMKTVCEQLQGSFNLANGLLLKAAIFQLEKSDHLVLIIHHLVVDGVSWRILLEDLSTLYPQALNNQKLTLPEKTDAFQTWSKNLKEYANSSAIEKEKAYWSNKVEEINGLKPLSNQRQNINRNYHLITIDFNKEVSSIFQKESYRAYRTEANDILLTALGKAIHESFGLSKINVLLEGHGRKEIISNIDIGRTVGWFTTTYPFILDMDIHNEVEDYNQELVQTKENLRKIPEDGIGYGLLNYTQQILPSKTDADIVFNYLGDFSVGSESETALFQFSEMELGELTADVNNDINAPLSVSGMIVDEMLSLNLKFGATDFSIEQMEECAKSYRANLLELINELSNATKIHLTPSDLTYKKLTIENVNTYNEAGNLEDVYQMSPMQQGLYFHWLEDKDSQTYFGQKSYKIRNSNLDSETLKNSYDQLVNRHSILRTAFDDNEHGDYLQIVKKEVPSNFEYLEPANADENYLNELRNKDRQKGFDLKSGSQMRLTVVRIDKDTYEFIWSNHHILMDGWCITILMNEFYQILNSVITDKPHTLVAPPFYSNYFNWLNKQDKTVTFDYWKSYLEGYDQPCTVPFRINDFSESKKVLKQLKFSIEGNQLNELRNLCKNNEVTENTFFQSVWGLLLSKYNNTSDVVFGAVVSGRPPEVDRVEEMIGLFINTIPVRINYSKSDTPISLMKSVQKNAINGLLHHTQNIADVQLLSEVGRELIDHIIVYENFAVQELSEEQQKANQLEVLKTEVFEQNNYGFSFQVRPSDDEVLIQLSFSEDKYTSEGMERLIQHFSNVVHAFIKDSNTNLNTLDYLTDEEKAKFQKGFNANEIDENLNQAINTLFENQVVENPNKIALQFGEVQHTYSALNQAANQLANFLSEQYKVEANDCVGINLERSSNQIVAILAILKLGAAYVPIETADPLERINFIKENSQCKLVFSNTDWTAFETQKAALNGNNLNRTIPLDSLAYIIYTSGSTGQPKGVAISHGALSDYVAGIVTKTNIKQCETFGLAPTIGADSGHTVLYTSLVLGGKLVVFGEDEIKDPVKMAGRQLDCLKIVPTHWSFLNTGNHRFLPQKCLIFGGEELGVNIIEKVKQKKAACEVYNHYGPTETTVGKLIHPVDLETTNSEIPIGKPFGYNSVYIIDDAEQLVPEGIIGELAISGKGLSNGYLHNPELTKEKFVNNPFKENERLYKTGDLVKCNADGDIVFIGRKDDQVKIRGFRIELGEIAAALNALEDVVDSAVIARKNGKGENEILAYLVNPLKELNTAELRVQLVDVLPSQMLPSHYLQIENIPFTTNGKLDKKALPTPSISNIINGVEYVEPKNEIQEKLVVIWEKVLDRKRIGIKDNFFDLGGHSLKVVGILSQIEREFKVAIDVKNVFQNPTIEKIADEIEFHLNNMIIDTKAIKHTIEI